MSLLLNIQLLSKSFGAQKLFEGVSFTVSDGDRLGVIGPNGSGKSTLLQILAGTQDADTGNATPRKGVRLGYVAQDSQFPDGPTVREVLESAVEPLHLEDTEKQGRVASTLGIAGFTDAGQKACALSGGWRKRLALAETLAAAPDIVLLDEPTNHLDLEGILWLEKLLAGASFAVVLVSHDRYFLENVSTSVAELNKIYPGGLFRVEGNYSRFLEKRAEFEAAQAKLEESLATKVKREVEWLRRGARARTTKSKARIDEAGRLIDQLGDVSARRTSGGAAQIDFASSGRKTKKLVETRELGAAVEGRVLFSKLNLRLSPGLRLGLVGSNGSGKTTLLRLLAGETQPEMGEIDRADKLKTVYFDQDRETLDPTVTLRRALAPDGDSVIYRERVVHVAGWAKRFLFRNDQLDTVVGRLSGGERARVLIARLMLQQADLLLMDEPTNDLDIATLEVLEESLTEFPGAMVLVTHDRFLLDRVSTAIVGLDGSGGVETFADCAQWEQWVSQRRAAKPEKAEREPAAVRSGGQAAPKKRLSYIESREWEGMESAIEAAERALDQIRGQMNEAAAAGQAEKLRDAYSRVEGAQAEVERLYARWAELEAKAQP